MDRFAKLYETEKYGQIIAIVHESDENHKPEMRVFAKPPGMGVCSVGFGFDDSDEGWVKADTALDNFDQDMADDVANLLFRSAPPEATDEQD